MRKTIVATALIAALPLIGTAHAEETSPFSANIGFVSDYAYRGISQTNERAAVQGGFDYAHDSGFYAGVWGTNISWLADANDDVSSSLEVDFYAGYAKEFGDFGVDVGLLQYVYPGSYPHGFNDPNTLEGYVGLSWKFVSFKYSQSFTDLFGTEDSKGSQYLDLSASYEIIDGLSLDAHYGRQRITGPAKSYADWKVGATYNFKGFDIGLHYVDTDMKDKDDFDADARYILSVSKSF